MFKYFLLSITCLFFLLSCESEQQVDLSKDLVVGVSADYPPFEFLSQGEIVGFDISLAHALGKVIGKKVFIQEIEFPALMPALQSKKINLVISGISKTPKRAQKFDFSNIYYHNIFSLLQKRDGSVKDVLDLAKKKIGAQTGSTMYHLLKELDGQGEAIDIIALNNNNALVEELKIGRIDGVLMEMASAKAYAKTNSDFTYTKIQQVSMGYAIMVNKNAPFLKEINQALSILKADGTLTQLQKEWLDQND